MHGFLILALFRFQLANVLYFVQVNPSVPLQTGFLIGMETLLGIHQSEVSLVEEINSPLRDAVKAADETAAANSAEAETGRKHLSRTYFEPVDEGQV